LISTTSQVMISPERNKQESAILTQLLVSSFFSNNSEWRAANESVNDVWNANQIGKLKKLK